MVRPRRWRHVRGPPDFTFFMPERFNQDRGVVILRVEEFEALRLKHYTKRKKRVTCEDGTETEVEVSLTQQEAAAEMGISQPTFSRILEEAHSKITKALVHGMAIRIEGGQYGFKEVKYNYGCQDCLFEWAVPEKFDPNSPIAPPCPSCGKHRTFIVKREFLKRYIKSDENTQ